MDDIRDAFVRQGLDRAEPRGGTAGRGAARCPAPRRALSAPLRSALEPMHVRPDAEGIVT